MRLGMIAPVEEASFKHAQELGLDFVEFCINGQDHGERLNQYKKEIPLWVKKYHVAVGSIGRWKSEILLPDGSIDTDELVLAKDLMKIAASLNCPNYVCGCNYAPAMSNYSNYCAAVKYFESILESSPESVRVSVYNCRKMNFINTEEAWSLVLGHLPQLGIKYDPLHSRCEGRDYLQELADWGDRVRHVHLQGSVIINGEFIDAPPAGLDQTDWKSVLNILRSRGYDGGLSIELNSPSWKGGQRGIGVRYTIKYFKDLLSKV